MSSRSRIARFAAGLTCAAGAVAAALAVAYVRSVPEPAPAAPWGSAGLSAATPEAVARLAAEVSATRARLRGAADFGRWLSRLEARWRVEEDAEEDAPGLEIRHLALAYRRPCPEAWPDLAGSVRELAAEPGLTIDSLALAAAPDGLGGFAEARLTLTLRLRRR